MEPDASWIEDWKVGVDPPLERSASLELVDILRRFWNAVGLGTMSKSTQRRYSGSLHALGGYLIGRLVSEEGTGQPIEKLLREAVAGGDGPLIFYHDEAWQRELDTTCRKVNAYLLRTRGG